MRIETGLTIRTVILPLPPPAPLLQALMDVRCGVNHLISDWKAHPEESRFQATKRTYRWTRERYSHLASGWIVVIANETSATLASWDKMLRRCRRLDSSKWGVMRQHTPRRVRLKAALHHSLYRIRGRTLDITIQKYRHVQFDLSSTPNPLFERYGVASNWTFGLSVLERGLAFQFRIPNDRCVAAESVGADVNMPSVDYVSSDGEVGVIDLRPITRVQGACDRKRRAIDRAIPTDLRLQRRVKGRYRRRERNRVDPLLHRAVNQFLERVGDRNIVLEDLTRTQAELMSTAKGREARRRLSVWTQGRFQRIVEYKAHTQVVHVDPRGTSSDCPRCGARMEHPEWRRSVCGNCQGDWHRDRAAATSILVRGSVLLWGEAPPPKALDALLELSRWDPEGFGR